MKKKCGCRFKSSLVFKLSYLLLAMMLVSQVSFSQNKELTPLSKVKKIGYLDHSMVRKEYKSYSDKLKQFAKESKIEKDKLDKALSVIDIEAERKMKRDSLAGSNRKVLLAEEYSEKRKAIFNKYQIKLKQIELAKRALMQDCEQKIKFAIDAVVSEGGFTDIKPIGKEVSLQEGVDITKLVLKKLN